ncbi:MAG: hypothetical protein J5654_11415 [Victivallales bacterium]|nr:hypothetical protein [Victivallales bacterium]
MTNGKGLLEIPIFRKLSNAFWMLLDYTLPDKLRLSLKYRRRFHRKLDWDNPKRFTEKIQWMKIYGRTPINMVMSDKYAVKKYIKERIGEQYVIPLLGVWDRPEDIDFSQLPDRFVLKCNHNSGTGMYICRDKSKLDENAVRKGLRKGLRQDYYVGSREYAYKGIPRKIIAEEYMEDAETKELRDYKFFCFDGEPKALFIAKDRLQGEHAVTFDFFDMDYNHLPFTNGHPNAAVLPEKPKCFEEMKALAATLSKGIPHVRVDFYEVNGKVYFGEFTFSHWGGLMPFDPDEWDYTFGSWLKLPKRQNLVPGFQKDI